MKILYHHRIASKDGQYIHLSAIIKEFRKEGHQVFLSGPKIEQASVMGGQNEWVHFLKKNIPNSIYELIEFSYCLFDFIRLILAIYKFKPDCIYERANLFFVSGIWAAKIFKLPLILEVNAPLFEERSSYDRISLTSLALWSEDYVWKNADVVLPVTQVLSNIVKSRVTPKQMEVIHNGISADDLEIKVQALEMRKKLRLEGKIILGFVGFVRNWHKLDRIIDFIDTHSESNLCLLIVGDGPDCQNLINYSAKKGLSEQLIMAGVVQRDMMASYINVFDVAIQPAVTEYASPLKLFEYLYLGKVIIAPNMGNIREIIIDGENGFLFSENDRDSLFNALEKALLLENKAIKERAYSTIIDKKFLWNENAKKIVQLFNQIK